MLIQLFNIFKKIRQKFAKEHRVSCFSAKTLQITFIKHQIVLENEICGKNFDRYFLNRSPDALKNRPKRSANIIFKHTNIATILDLHA